MARDPSSARPSRRAVLAGGGRTLASLALIDLLGAGTQASQGRGLPHFAPRARRAIHICLVGGLSQVDSFDYKPELERFHGRTPPMEERPDVFFGKVGLLRQSDFAFRRRGQSGLWVSDLFPHLAQRADDLTVIRSMHSQTANHTPGLFLANSGFQRNGFPSLGGWLSFGLGNEAQDLPTYVVIPDARGAPSGGASNWSNGFLPGRHQGVTFRSGSRPVRDLFPPETALVGADAAVRELVGLMDQRHLARLGGQDATIEARLGAYELAARLQLSVPGTTDLSREPESVTRRYGLHEAPTTDFARSCLVARRLLERGVRFVQLYSGRSARRHPAHELGRARGQPREPCARSPAHRPPGRGAAGGP